MKAVKATKSNERPLMESNEKQKRTSELEKPKQAIKVTKGPNGNQALEYN